MRRARDGGKRAIGGISSVGIRQHGKDIAGAMDHALKWITRSIETSCGRLRERMT
jgi:hypothetical protein